MVTIMEKIEAELVMIMNQMKASNNLEEKDLLLKRKEELILSSLEGNEFIMS